MEIIPKQDHESDDNGLLHPTHEVTITIDDQSRIILSGIYSISQLKVSIGIPADYELNQVINGTFHALADTSEIPIRGNEILVSHVRRGGSS